MKILVSGAIAMMVLTTAWAQTPLQIGLDIYPHFMRYSGNSGSQAESTGAYGVDIGPEFRLMLHPNFSILGRSQIRAMNGAQRFTLIDSIGMEEDFGQVRRTEFGGVVSALLRWHQTRGQGWYVGLGGFVSARLSAVVTITDESPTPPGFPIPTDPFLLYEPVNYGMILEAGYGIQMKPLMRLEMGIRMKEGMRDLWDVQFFRNVVVTSRQMGVHVLVNYEIR
ncbi:hypothetical protein [Pontibacter sp. G13]|uniref:hypothetical protein n=1 Tax=Pontibacter sp. G13 TaxID=3074898 RepID=UPI0028891060|nr:hypothetical protein [Pontibacter sp. G13]WNJ18460.1 hypothetical protein RJD25_26695 [Pontibacter sp. G13]